MTRRWLYSWIVVAACLRPAAGGAAPPPDLACGTREHPPARWEHVVWIFFENHGFRDVVGSSAAPFINRVLRPACGLAAHYDAVAHPSLPNYIAATSGLPPDALGRWRRDCNATAGCRTDVPSIFAQAPSWGAYAESMRRPCVHWFAGRYAASHNPAVYYRGLDDCADHDVPLRGLRTALDTDTLPAFVFVTPDLCSSMHSCGVGAGDTFLRRILGDLTASAAYQRGTMAIFVTFDESEKDTSDLRVPTFVVSPSTPPGTRSEEPFSHYSLLRTTEEMLGVDELLGNASRARSMRAAFNL